MPQNQYLPIAYSPTANAVTPAQWAAMSALLQQGFSSGEVLSSYFNTFLRQFSVPISAVAQFIADNQTQDVLDDGSVANFEAKFGAALRSYVEIEGIAFASDGGTSDIMSANPTPALTSYKIGQAVAILKNASVAGNQTATPTLNLNGLGAVTIVKASGAPLYAGDLAQGAFFFCIYDGTYFRHIGLTPSTAALIVQAGQAVAFAASGTNTYTGTLVPAPTALTAKMEVLGFFASPNTSASAPTLLLNGIGNTLPILKQGGGVPSAGDVAGILPLVLNSAGTAWIINGLVPSDVLSLISTNAPKFPAGTITGNGYWRDPNTGFTIQWGQGSMSGGSLAVTFPRAFTTFFCAVSTDDGAATWTNTNATFMGIASPSATGFTARGVNWTGSAMQPANALFGWIAIGLS